MSLLMKFVRNLSYSNYRYKVTFLNSIKCLQSYNREFHNNNNKLFAKMYLEHENRYAYSILENKGYARSIKTDDVNSAPLTHEEFQDILKTNWSKKTPSEMFDIFLKLGVYCSANNICISDKMFDVYIDHLTDNLKSATDEELELVLSSLSKWPDTKSVRTRNYIEVWVALDDECRKRMISWPNDKLLDYLSLFYMVNVIKYSDFSVKSLQKLSSKAKQLTPAQVVYTMFFIGIWRKQPFDMHNLEVHFNNNFSQYSIDEIAIISMGFFKSKTPIRDMGLVSKIINLVIENATDIHEVSLAALLKVIRYSIKLPCDNRIYKLLDTLQHEVGRLSVMCNVHVALVGSTTLTLHKECLTKIADAIIKSMSQTRVKDLERLVLTYGTFNLKPSSKECFFTKVMDELRKPEREEERLKYGRSFACCISYLALLQIYPEDLISKVLSPEFLEHTYGKCFTYGREILTLHNAAQLFCPDAKINRLTENQVKILAKKYTDYVPSEEFQKQYNVTEKMMLDVMKVMRESRGGKKYVVGDHILSHHQRGDIIICNKPDGTPAVVQDVFLDKDFGLLRRPPDSNRWIALIIGGRNAQIFNSSEATGYYTMKIRELEALGYRAALVPFNMYNSLDTMEEKENYLNNLINNALKKSVGIIKCT